MQKNKKSSLQWLLVIPEKSHFGQKSSKPKTFGSTTSKQSYYQKNYIIDFKPSVTSYKKN